MCIFELTSHLQAHPRARRVIFAAALAIAALAADRSAYADPAAASFVFTAEGPESGQGVMALGIRTYFILPAVDFNYRRALTDRLSFTADASSIAVLDTAAAGFSYRLAGERGSGVALALRGSLSGLIEVSPDHLSSNAVGGGFRPGIVASFGSENLRFSVGTDLVWLAVRFNNHELFDGASKTESFVALDPAFTVEGKLGANLSGYVQAKVDIAFSRFDTNTRIFLPIPELAVGLSW